jgi:hypothetical protein
MGIADNIYLRKGSSSAGQIRSSAGRRAAWATCFGEFALMNSRSSSVKAVKQCSDDRNYI